MPTSKEKKEERKRRGLKKSRKGQKVKQPGCVPGSAAHLSQLWPCSKSVELAGKGRRGVVLRRVWKELHGSSPGAPRRALLRGTGHGASLYTHRSLGVLAMGIRRQSHPVANASNSSLFWALNDSSSSVFPKERGTKSCLLLPLWVYQCFLTLSL